MSKILREHGIDSIYSDNLSTICELMKADFDEYKRNGSIKNDVEFESIFATYIDVIKKHVLGKPE